MLLNQIQFCVKLSILPIRIMRRIPISLNDKYTGVSLKCIESKRTSAIIKVWLFVACLGFCQTTLQLYSLVYVSTDLNLMSVIIQGTLLEFRLMCITNVATFLFNPKELCQLLNALLVFDPAKLYQYNHGHREWKTKAKKRACLENILVAVITVTCINVMFTVPLFASFVFPCTHSFFVEKFNRDCVIDVGLWYKLLTFSMEFLFQVPSLSSCMVIACGTVMSLNRLLVSMEGLTVLLKKFRIKNCRGKCLWEIVMNSYTQLRILSILFNLSFQQFFLPTIQFIGSFVIIFTHYCLIVMFNWLPGFVKCLLFGQSIVTMIFCFVVLNYGSRPVEMSKVIAALMCRREPPSRQRSWIRSCQLIQLKIGPFHNLDRLRGPAMLRFCLQRIFFFVMKTQSSS